MKKTIFLILILLTVSLMGCAQHSKSNPNSVKLGKEIAEKVKAHYESARTVKGYEHLVILENGKSIVDNVEFVIKKPDKIWMYDLTRDAYLIFNGTCTWIYSEKTKSATVDRAKPNHPPDYARFIEGLMTIFNVNYSGNKTLNGTKCYVLKLTPNASTNAEVYGYMYVTPAYKVSRIYFRLENTVYDIWFKDIVYNASVNDSLFNFTPPKGVKVYKVIEKLKVGCYKNVSEAQKYLTFKLILPSYTANYKFKDVCLYGAKALLEYIKGADEMLVEETVLPLVYPSSAKNVSLGNVTVHVWTKEGRTYAVFSVNGIYVEVSAPMSTSEMLKVCKSIVG